MSKIIFFILIILILGLGLLLLFRFKEEQKQVKPPEEIMDQKIKSKELKGISIITIYDNYLVNPDLKTGWGFSCLIKLDNQNILFDTGADSPTLLSNMEKMKIDSKQIETVILSHNHFDHIGGLEGFLEANQEQAQVYQPTIFSQPTKITDQIYSTGALGIFIKEQSLIIETSKGLVIITGCAHPGIVNIIKKTKEIFPEKNIYLVLGGFHLSGASDFQLKDIIASFRELAVQKVAPCHCSGDKCRELFKQEYQEDFIKNGVGNIIEI